MGINESQDLVRARGVDGGDGSLAGDTGISGRTQHGRDVGVALEAPGKGVFAAAASEDENTHDSWGRRLW